MQKRKRRGRPAKGGTRVTTRIEDYQLEQLDRMLDHPATNSTSRSDLIGRAVDVFLELNWTRWKRRHHCKECGEPLWPGEDHQGGHTLSCTKCDAT